MTAHILAAFEASAAASKEGKARRAAEATDLLIELVTSRYPQATDVSAEFPWYLDGGTNENDEWRVYHLDLPYPAYRLEREYDGGLTSGDHDGPDEFGEFTVDEMKLMDRLAKKGRKDPRWRHFRGSHDEVDSMSLSLPQPA